MLVQLLSRCFSMYERRMKDIQVFIEEETDLTGHTHACQILHECIPTLQIGDLEPFVVSALDVTITPEVRRALDAHAQGQTESQEPRVPLRQTELGKPLLPRPSIQQNQTTHSTKHVLGEPGVSGLTQHLVQHAATATEPHDRPLLPSQLSQNHRQSMSRKSIPVVYT